MSPSTAETGVLSAWLPAASSYADRVDGVLAGLLVTSLAVVLLLGCLTLYILVRYRRDNPANRDPVGIATWKIEAAWTVVTAAVFLFFFIRGASAFIDMHRTPAGTIDINVIGRQWMWDVRYPDGRREFNSIHLRCGQPVRLLLSSEDVIHSFFVPAFRMKQDVVPGKVVSAWVEPTRPGTYTLFCAQYCGSAHANMTGTVVVLSPGDYASWLGNAAEAGKAGLPGFYSEDRGRELYVRYGCFQCHDERAGARAPSLAGLYGSAVTLRDGRRVFADEQYLHDAILLSPKYVVAGYQSTMPTYAGVISESDCVDLVTYVKALRRPVQPAP